VQRGGSDQFEVNSGLLLLLRREEAAWIEIFIDPQRHKPWKAKRMTNFEKREIPQRDPFTFTIHDSEKFDSRGR